MDPDFPAASSPGQQSAGDPMSESGLAQEVWLLWRALSRLAHDHFRLVTLETQRAGASLVTMIAAGVMVAVLLNGAWLGLLAAIVLELINQGISVSSAILLAVAFNVLAALLGCGVIRRKSRYLLYPATRRTLESGAGRTRDTPKTD